MSAALVPLNDALRIRGNLIDYYTPAEIRELMTYLKSFPPLTRKMVQKTMLQHKIKLPRNLKVAEIAQRLGKAEDSMGATPRYRLCWLLDHDVAFRVARLMNSCGARVWGNEMDSAKKINGIPFVCSHIPGLDSAILIAVSDELLLREVTPKMLRAAARHFG